MHPQLEELEREFEGALARLRGLADSAGEEEWRRHPPHGGWSVAQCVIHLNLMSEAMLPAIDRGLDEARRRGGSMPLRLRRDPLGWLIWKSVAPGGGMKVSTTPSFVPSSDGSRDEIVADFERLQAQQIERVRAADGLPIHAVKIRSVIDARVRYSVFSALSISANHEHRHLGQAERALAAIRAGEGG